MSKTCNSSQVHLLHYYMEEIMPKLPWWLNLRFKIMLVDLVIALLVKGNFCEDPCGSDRHSDFRTARTTRLI